MRKFVGMISEAVELVHKVPKILLLGIGFALLPRLSEWLNFPLIISVILALVAVGWYGTKFWFLYEVYRGNKTEFGKLPQYLWRYLLRLLPGIGLLVGIGLVSVVAMLLWFLGWFASMFAGEIGSTSEVLRQSVRAFGQASVRQAFFSQSLVTLLVGQMYLLFLLVGMLVVRLTVVVMVIKKTPIWKSLRVAFTFLTGFWWLLVGFLVLRIMMNVGLYSVRWLMPSVLIEKSFLWVVIGGALSVYMEFILDAYVLVFYLKRVEKSNKPTLKKKIRRPDYDRLKNWHSLGRER